jgi:hypothetical protein
MDPNIQGPLIRQSTADDLSLYQPLFTPARAGSTCKFMTVLQSSLDQAEVSPARSGVHDHEFFQDADRPTKNVGIIGVQRLPTAHLLPTVHQRKFGTSVYKIPHSPWPRNQKRLRRAAIAFTYSCLTTYGMCKLRFLQMNPKPASMFAFPPALLQDRREVLTAISTSGNPNSWSRV